MKVAGSAAPCPTTKPDFEEEHPPLSPLVVHLLHGDDPEVVLLAAPDEERLVLVEEDAATDGPVLKGVGRLQKAITLL